MKKPAIRLVSLFSNFFVSISLLVCVSAKAQSLFSNPPYDEAFLQKKFAEYSRTYAIDNNPASIPDNLSMLMAFRAILADASLQKSLDAQDVAAIAALPAPVDQRFINQDHDELNAICEHMASADGATAVQELASRFDAARAKKEETLDARYGRPLTTTFRIDSVDSTFINTYNPDGKLETVQYPSGFVARYEYSASQNYLQYLKDPSGGVLWVAGDRNADGQYTQAATSSGLTIKRSFNAQTGRMTALTAGPASALTSVANLSFACDTLGNLTSRGDVTQALTETFTYDALNRLKTAAIGSNTRQVNYNAAGNIVSKTRLGATTLNTYSYPATGAARPYAASSITGVVNGVTNPSFAYDANGNLQSGAGRSYGWTSFNMAASVTQGSTSVSYVYDAQHQRMKQTSGGVTVKYFNDPISGVSAEQVSTGGGTWHDYLFVDGERIALRIKTTSPAAVSWQMYINDHQGSIAVVTDAVGAVTQRMSYDAWGRPRQPNGTEDPSGAITRPTSRGYTGHEHLPGVSVINMNGRLYDPEVGQFLSPDPVTQNVYEPQALNRNSYVLNNPLFYTDPTGFSKWTTFRDKWLKPVVALAVAWNVGGYLFDSIAHWGVASSSAAAGAGSAAAAGGATASTFGSTMLAGIASGSLVGGINGVIFNGPRGFALGMKNGAIGGAISGAFAFMNPGNTWDIGRLLTDGYAGGVTSLVLGGSFGDGFRHAAIGSALRVAFHSTAPTTPKDARPLTALEKLLLSPYNSKEALDAARLIDGRVPFWLSSKMGGVTLGRNIYLGEGQYERGGLAMLGHEVVHVAQYLNGMTLGSYLWDWALHKFDYENMAAETEAYSTGRKINGGQ